MKIVIDANVGVHTVLDTPLSNQVEAAWDFWREKNAAIYVPSLWLNEVTSVIHRVHMLGEISEKNAIEALNIALGLDLEIIHEEENLCVSAFKWASRMGQHAAYDGFYLALSEQLEAEFWSLDQKMVHKTKQLDVSWSHWVGEIK